MLLKRLFFNFILSFLFLPFSALAFKVSPIELNFSNKGPRSVQTILVENTTPDKIPVEIFAYERTHKKGKEKRVKTRDFYFFPRQFILKPGEKRNIRLSWMGLRSKTEPKDKTKRLKKGKTNLDSEKAYRLEVRQVPVDLKKAKGNKTGIKFLYNYVASLYVKPDKAKPFLEVYSYKKKNQEKYEFEIQNSGSAHAILAFYDLEAKKGKSKALIKMLKQESEIQGVNLLPGERRKLTLKVPKEMETGALEFEFKKRL
jgi:fimbrial chaperone protein